MSLGIRPRFSSRLLTHSNEAELIRQRKADIRPNDRVGSVPWGRTGDREVAGFFFRRQSTERITRLG